LGDERKRSKRDKEIIQMTHAPPLIRLPGPLVGRLLRIGVPMGPNVVLTVRGRKSGKPRSAPVAVAEHGGRRWIVGLYGDVHWTRNLRAAGEAHVAIKGRTDHVQAVELNHGEATRFFGEILPSYIAALPLLWRVLVRLLVRFSAPDVLTDPASAAAKLPVFELRAVPSASSTI
jgi:deazaflavin-dependent oxidoreductase (nitroreductase family)